MIQRRWFWVITTVIGILIGLGSGQLIQFQKATAEGQHSFSQLRAELNALKAKQRTLQAEWQAELLAQVVPTLTNTSDRAKRQFVDFLQQIGNSGTPALIAMLQDPSEQIRRKAADKLGAIGERERKAKRNVDAIAIGLTTALQDPSHNVLREAIQELADVLPTSAESLAVVVPALIAVRTRGDSATRADVLDLLGRIGESLSKNGETTDPIRNALIAGLTDKSSKVRTNAIDELSDIRAASSETFTALIGRLADRSKSVRNRAENALIELGNIDMDTAIPMLADAFEQSRAPAVRHRIVDVLGGIAENVKTITDSHEIIVETLLVALQDPHENVRRNAADELGEMRATSPDVRSALENAFNDKAKKVRNAARKAMRRIKRNK